ncbi:MAG: hypothetical protein ACK5Z5_00770 [Neisseriaceae bacterium]
MAKNFTILLIIVSITVLIGSCSNLQNIQRNVVKETRQSKGQSRGFLIKPNGKYGVGYKDFFFTDNKHCPDIVYSKNPNMTYQYFQKNNFKHCHQIVTRVYYPTEIKDGVSDYYPIVTNAIQNELKHYSKINSFKDNLNSEDIKQLNGIKSFTTKDAKLALGKFPVILFTPRYGRQVQMYENFITSLVSNGYIVVGINSPFISPNIMMSNNSIAPFIYDYKNIDNPEKFFNSLKTIVYPTITNDTEFVYSKIKNKDIDNDLSNAIESNNIGAFGDVFGGRRIITATLQGKISPKAIVGLNLQGSPKLNTSAASKIPVLNINFIFSGRGIDVSHFKVGSKDILIFFTSGATEFDDSLTLKNTNAFKSIIKKMPMPNVPELKSFLLYGNGSEITNSINTYVLQFFDMHLKSLQK